METREDIELENLIKEENDLTNKQTKNSVIEININMEETPLEKFIKRIKKEINLPAYFKSQMERIIIDNSPPKEDNKNQ